MKLEHYIPTQVYYKIFKRIPLKERLKKQKRANVGTLEDAGGEKIYSRKIPLENGYDKGGAYWERPKNSDSKVLYVDYTISMKYICFIWREVGAHLKKHKSKYSTVAKSDSVYGELLASVNRENIGSRSEAEKAKKKIYCRELMLKNGIDAGGYNWGKVTLVCVYFTEDKTYVEWEKPQYGISEKAKLILG